MSLWVNGVEEKSRLTTKAKADSAYVTIVGRERRDPALMHWQEGNKITVTVFPCTPQEDRRFKIGLTVPLRDKGKHLELSNLSFVGPEARNAEESTRIEIHHETSSFIKKPKGFKKKNAQVLIKAGSYHNHWTLHLDKPALNSNPFIFQEKKYSLTELEMEAETFNPKQIFLDINATWTKSEIKKVIEWSEGKTIYVYQDGLIKLTTANQKEIIKDLLRYRFSIIPLNEIPAKANTLFITKGSANTPNLKDLKNSKFEIALQTYFDDVVQMKVFNIEDEISSYLASLSGFKVLDVHKGSLQGLHQVLQAKTWMVPKNSFNKIPIKESKTMIMKESVDNNKLSNGPDHLMRLHHFNKILNQIGPAYFKANTYPENGEIIKLAKEAHILSPVSSMIVLETKKDYDRFDISKSKNSLGNAAMEGSGSVPEPHEWVLIILAVLAVIILKYKTSI